MNAADLKDIIKKGESEIVEFKSSFDNETIETLVAFANTKGGKVILGVSDKKEVKGVTIHNETTQKWINEINSSVVNNLVTRAMYF